MAISRIILGGFLMKKALKMLLVALMFAAVSSVALAQDAGVSIGAWGRGLFIPMSSPVGADEEVAPTNAASWGGQSRIGFTVRGQSENVGFHVDVNADGGDGLGTHDQQFIWVSPMDGLKLSVGPTIFYDTLRGNSAYGSWNWARPSFIAGEGEDSTFARGLAGENNGWIQWFESPGDPVVQHNGGALLSYDMNNIHVFAAWDTVATDPGTGAEGVVTVTPELAADEEAGTEAVPAVTDDYTTATMFAAGQYGAGYDIAGIGQVRAQYIGRVKPNDDGEEIETWAIINAAVKIDQMVQNLYTDFGFFMPTDDEMDNMEFALYARYTMAPMTFHLSTEIEMDAVDAEGEEGMGIDAGVGLGYDLGDGLGIDSDFRFANEGASGNLVNADGEAVSAWSALLGLEKGFSNGKIGAGFQVTNASFATKGKSTAGDPDTMAWAVPVKLEYWF